MDRNTIIDGLKMTMELCVFDPSTGEEIEPHLLNDINRATYDACKGALEILERLGTNLAEVGTDLISRQAAIDALCNDYCGGHQDCKYYPNCENLRSVQKLPPAQPEIIRCRECKFASGDSRICMQFGHSPIGELDFCAWAERKTDE